ncbi:hypothetical protein I79_011321 [Cricetulus griseus]|uniref:Uncharacterized protein n=1 Tax=Cricetulus griseus TaxID=10029 RepID=G3HKU1_CRIGR|nr:hypothetical protein I79_011321 [Cricetulus griseus]
MGAGIQTPILMVEQQALSPLSPDFFLLFCFFSHCSPDCPRTHRDPPDSAS